MTANRIFDRVVIPVRQRPLSTDHNRMFGTLQEQKRRLALLEYGQRQSTAVLDGGLGSATLVDFQTGFTPTGFRVETAVGMSVAVKGGPDCFGWSEVDVTSETDFGGNLGVEIGPLAPTPLVLTVTQDLVVPAAPAPGSSRIDIIEVRPEATLADTLPNSIWDVILRRFTTQNVPKTLTWDLDGLTGTVNSPAVSTAAISYKKGVEAVGAISAATEPSGTTGYTTIARINVVGGTTAITAAMIADRRALLVPQGIVRARVSVTIGSATGGLGSEAFVAVHAPPGVWFRLVNISAIAGSSRYYKLYMFGVRAPSLSTVNALLTGSADNFSPVKPILVTTSPGTAGTVGAALRATLNSGASIGGAVDIAEGTPVIEFDVLAVTTTQLTADLPAAAFPVTLDITVAQAI